MSSLLTGVSHLQVDMANLLRDGELESLVQFDIDSFSSINKDRGIEVGDRVLEILENLLSGDVKSAYRTGGDQYALLQVDRQRTWGLCDEFRLECERTLGFEVTVSGGGVVIDPDCVLPTAQSVHLLSGAVAEVQATAKHSGRNSILWLEATDADPEPAISETARKLFLNLAKINAAAAREMEVESRIDVLTGLYNRRGFEDIFGREVEVASRTNNPLALIYLDSDSLKQINDQDGHEAGDRFIVDMSTVLRSVVRRSDFVFRWGADEFAVVLEPTEVDTASVLAERIRAEVAAKTKGTVSVGIYHGIPKSTEDAVRLADEAMYAAKRAGKNNVRSIADASESDGP